MTTTLYRREIEQAAREHGLDADVVEALVLVESSGQADAFRWEPTFFAKYLATNPAYAGQIPRRIGSSYGLMQIMLSTAREHGFNAEPEFLFLPGVNLDIGCRVLKGLLKWAGGDLAKALEGFNGGKGSIGSEATTRYAAKVLATLLKVREARQGVRA